MDGIASYHRATAGEGACPPIKFGSVTCGQAHIFDRYAQLLGDNLGEGGVVALALRANAGCHADAPADLDRDFCTFVGANACSLDIGDEAQPDVFAFSTQTRLLD